MFAKEKDFMFFEIKKNMGGRFSVLSSVGIVPLTFAQVDTFELLNSAKQFFDEFFQKKHLHILQKAAFFVKNCHKFPINILFPYSTAFKDFNQWYKQLWAESLGKKDKNNKRISLLPLTLIGPIDQHSFLQLIIDGENNKTVTFIKIKNFAQDIQIPFNPQDFPLSSCFDGLSLGKLLNLQCLSTMESLKKESIPIDMIEIEKLNEHSLGKLIAYFELLTSAVGALLGIETYNQPAVEFGKKILFELVKKEKK